MASLLVITGSTAGEYYLLGQDAVVIGRDEGSPIQIVDEAVSRQHLRRLVRMETGRTRPRT